MKTKILLLFIVVLFSTNGFSQTSSISDFIKEWINVPYRFGGTTKKGIDCSAFTQKLYSAVFSLDIPRTAYYQFKDTERVLLDDLRAGDLLFFTSKLSPSGWHVGVYLGDSTFVHAANRRDNIKISRLFDPLYLKSFKGGGRVKQNKL